MAFSLMKKRPLYTALPQLAPNPDPLKVNPNAYDEWKERLRTVHGDDPAYSKVPWNMRTGFYDEEGGVHGTLGIPHPGSGRSFNRYPVHRGTATKIGEFMKWKDVYPMAGKPTVQYKKAKGPTAPTAEEKAEALKLAMEDAAKYSGAMQGKTIPGVPPGGGSREHQMSVYNTGGYDLTSNRPIADTDVVRKRLYGIMGFGRQYGRLSRKNSNSSDQYV